MPNPGGKGKKGAKTAEGKLYSIRPKGTKPSAIDDDEDGQALEAEPMKSIIFQDRSIPPHYLSEWPPQGAAMKSAQNWVNIGAVSEYSHAVAHNIIEPRSKRKAGEDTDVNGKQTGWELGFVGW
jgi:hypothetical protein